jgi:hypothetical protein
VPRLRFGDSKISNNQLFYIDPPVQFSLPDSYRGISPSLRDLDFDQVNLFYRYRDPPATIEAEFGDDGSILVYLYGKDEVFIVTKSARGNIVASHPQARMVTLPRINILPRLALLRL